MAGRFVDPLARWIVNVTRGSKGGRAEREYGEKTHVRDYGAGQGYAAFYSPPQVPSAFCRNG